MLVYSQNLVRNRCTSVELCKGEICWLGNTQVTRTLSTRHRPRMIMKITTKGIYKCKMWSEMDKFSFCCIYLFIYQLYKGEISHCSAVASPKSQQTPNNKSGNMDAPCKPLDAPYNRVKGLLPLFGEHMSIIFVGPLQTPCLQHLSLLSIEYFRLPAISHVQALQHLFICHKAICKSFTKSRMFT